MTRHRKTRFGAALVAGVILIAPLRFSVALAQQQTPVASPSPAATASPLASPVPASPTPAAPTPSPSAQGAPAAPATPAASPSPTPTSTTDSGSMGETRELVSRPAAYVEAKASRDEVFGAIMSSIDAIRAEIGKAGLKAAGRPIAVFLQADDVGFTYRAEIPIETAPDGKTSLSDTVKLGQTPVGKAMRFEHRAAYDDIDGTYEAITAYLDEKGIDAQDLFIEEYLNDVKAPDDPNLQVDIFVMLK